MTGKTWMFIGALALVAAYIFLGPSGPRSGGSKGSSLTAPSDDAVAFISHGAEVDIEAHLKEGRRTLVVFTADW